MNRKKKRCQTCVNRRKDIYEQEGQEGQEDVEFWYCGLKPENDVPECYVVDEDDSCEHWELREIESEDNE